MGPNGAVPSTPASIILIDRQLDTVTPARHHPHVLDCIFGQLESRSCSSDTNYSKANGRGNRNQGLPSGTDYSEKNHRNATNQHLPSKAGHSLEQDLTGSRAKQPRPGAADESSVVVADEHPEMSLEAEEAQSQEPAPLGRPHRQMISMR